MDTVLSGTMQSFTKNKGAHKENYINSNYINTGPPKHLKNI